MTEQPSTDVEPAGEHEAGPFDHLTDRALMEGIAHALNAQAEQVAWLVSKVVQAESMIAAAANDPKLRMLMPKIGG